MLNFSLSLRSKAPPPRALPTPPHPTPKDCPSLQNKMELWCELKATGHIGESQTYEHFEVPHGTDQSPPSYPPPPLPEETLNSNEVAAGPSLAASQFLREDKKKKTTSKTLPSIFDPLPQRCSESKIPITDRVGSGSPTPASMLEDRSELFFLLLKNLLLNVTILMLVIDPKTKRIEKNKCERKQVIWVFGSRFSRTGGQTDRPGEP